MHKVKFSKLYYYPQSLILLCYILILTQCMVYNHPLPCQQKKSKVKYLECHRFYLLNTYKTLCDNFSVVCCKFLHFLFFFSTLPRSFYDTNLQTFRCKIKSKDTLTLILQFCIGFINFWFIVWSSLIRLLVYFLFNTVF